MSQSQEITTSAVSDTTGDRMVAGKSGGRRDSLLWRSFAVAKRYGYFASSQAFERAMRWMNRLVKGNPIDFRAPYFIAERDSKGKIIEYHTYEFIKDGFRKFLARKKTALSPNLRELLDEELEKPNAEKIGSKSKHLGYFEDGPKKAAAVYSDKPKSSLPLDHRAYSQALEKLAALVPSNTGKTRSIREVARESKDLFTHDLLAPVMDLSTNSGPDQWLSPWGEILDEIVAYAISVYSKMVHDDDYVPQWRAGVGQRLVSRGLEIDEKTKRLIIALEKAEPLIVKALIWNIMQYMKDNVHLSGGVQTFCAWKDLPWHDYNMQLMLWKAHKAGRTVLSTDFSNYDSTIPPWLIVDTCKVLGSWITGHERVMEKMGIALAYNTSLLTPAKFFEPQPSSMKSGSGLTNIIDGLCQIAIWFYGEALGLFELENLAVQGDDGVGDGPGLEPGVFEEAASHFGVIANHSKQFYQPNALMFLQRLHILGAPGGIGSVYRYLGSFLNYERMRYSRREWSPKADCTQAISKLENADFNPDFVSLVQFAQLGDKYKLFSDIPASQVLKGAGRAGQDILQRQFRESFKQPITMGRNGFEHALTNRVLRGYSPPPFGSVDLFSEIYAARAEEVLPKLRVLLGEIGSYTQYWS